MLTVGWIFATSWIYMTEIAPAAQVELAFVISNAAVFVPGLLFSLVLGRHVDKTRRVKLLMIISLFLCMIGSILYMMSFFNYRANHWTCFKWIPTCFPTCHDDNQKIIRSYPEEELSQKMALLFLAQHVGVAVAPLLPLPFKHLDIWYGAVHISYANISGLILLFLTIVLQCLVVCCSHDLSREYDLKANETERRHLIAVNDMANGKELKAESLLEVIYKVFDKYWTLQNILLLSFVGGVLHWLNARILPVIAIENLKYSVEIANYTMLVNAIVGVVASLVISKLKLKDKGMLLLGIISNTAIFLCGLSLQLISQEGNVGINIFLLFCFGIGQVWFSVGDLLFLNFVISKTIPFTKSEFGSRYESWFSCFGCINWLISHGIFT